MARKEFQKVENLNPAFRWRDLPKAIWYLLREDRGKFVWASIVIFIIQFLDLLPAILGGKIVDFFTSYTQGDSLTLFYIYVFVLAGAYTFAAFVRIQAKKVTSRIGHNLRARARVWGFERLMEFSLQWHAKENMGNKIQRIYTGGQALKDFMYQYQNKILQAATYFIGFIGVMFFFSYQLAIFLAVFIIVIMTIEFTFNIKIAKMADQWNKLDQTSGGVFIEGSGNILAIKSLGTETQMHGRIRAMEERTRDFGISKSLMGFRKWTYFRLFDGPAYGLFLLLVGYNVIQGMISVGTILICFTYFIRMREMLWDISDMNEKVVDYKSDIGNMMPIFWEETHAPTGDKPLPNQWREIAMQNASFAYPSGQVGLHKLNLKIERGGKFGVAGSSGGGKSTLVKILLGLYRIQGGTFSIGNVNFYDISHEELMKNVSVVLQESELFNISLRENITMMREEDPELLQKAIEISQLSEVIAKLPEGVNTLIGERGYMLSGGERQRLGIARAIYKNSEVMIFDEATSSLDSETERKIMEGLLGDFGKSRTMIIVAHRLSTLANTYRVVVFEEGTVVEEGTYRELLGNDGSMLAKLSKTQHAQQS
ncbi:MAG: ABC transporter ATP-binding protein [Patescibacteria group bacterium]